MTEIASVSKKYQVRKKKEVLFLSTSYFISIITIFSAIAFLVVLWD